MEQVKASTDAQLENVMPAGPQLVLHTSRQQIASLRYSSGALIIGHK